MTGSHRFHLRRVCRLALTSVLALSVLCISTLSHAAISAMHRSYGPRSISRVANPTVMWEVWGLDGGKITSSKMTLNGQSVEASYNPGKRALLYTPKDGLASGDYAVYAEVTVEKQLVVKREWRFTVAAGARTALAAPSSSQYQTLDAVNAYRRMLGLPEAHQDDRFNAASLSHSLYLKGNKKVGHYENPNEPGFTGNASGDRLEAFGYVGSSYECVCARVGSLDDSIRLLFDAPYHRIAFMAPGEVTFGSGFDGSNMTMEFGTTGESKVVVSPAPNQKDVPTGWRCSEVPNPLRNYNSSVNVGYPIVLSSFGEGTDKVKLISASLRTASGDDVDIFINSPTNDEHLDEAILLIPKKTLAPKTTYKVEIRATTASGKDVSRSWSFVTAAN